MMRGDANSVNAIALQQVNDSSRAIKGMGQEKPKKKSRARKSPA
jgi:hypothetical protein